MSRSFGRELSAFFGLFVCICIFGSRADAAPETHVWPSQNPVCKYLGYWAPPNTTDYTRDGIAVHAGPNGPTIEVYRERKAGPKIPAQYRNRGLRTSSALGDFVYSVTNENLVSRNGVLKRFVSWPSEAGCDDGEPDVDVITAPGTPEDYFKRVKGTSSCKRVVTEDQLQHIIKIIGFDPPKDHLTLLRGKAMLWNGASVDWITAVVSLRQAAQYRPLPYVVLKVDKNANAETIRQGHNLLATSLQCNGIDPFSPAAQPPASAAKTASLFEVSMQGLTCTKVTDELGLAVVERNAPIAPQVNRLTVVGNREALWNGAPVSDIKLGQYLTTTAAIDPKPFVIINFTSQSSSMSAEFVRTVLLRSGYCSNPRSVKKRGN